MAYAAPTRNAEHAITAKLIKLLPPPLNFIIVTFHLLFLSLVVVKTVNSPRCIGGLGETALPLHSLSEISALVDYFGDSVALADP